MWLKAHSDRRKTVNPNSGSYGMKHRVEAWTYRETGTREYIFEGSFVEACRRDETVDVHEISRGSARFNIPMKYCHTEGCEPIRHRKCEYGPFI